jgi:hypothetical protein
MTMRTQVIQLLTRCPPEHLTTPQTGSPKLLIMRETVRPDTNLNVSPSEVDRDVQSSEMATAEQDVSIFYSFG